MKIILLFITLAFTLNCYSKCKSNGWTFFPSKSKITENSLFIIDGYGRTQEIINNIGKTHNTYLKSGEEKIKLNVIEILVGQFNITQVVLKPEKNLTSGKEYELIIEGIINEYDKPTRYNSATNKYEKVIWKVTSNIDIDAPKWITKPIFKNSLYVMFGCGPDVSSNFTFMSSDSSEFLIRTTVKNLTTGKQTSYYLSCFKNIIEIGHGMCSGAFDFGNDEKFEVEFTLMDLCGNTTVWKGDRITFNNPKNN